MSSWKKVIDKEDYKYCPFCAFDNWANPKRPDIKMYRVKINTDKKEWEFMKKTHYYQCLTCGFGTHFATEEYLKEYLSEIEYANESKT